MAYQTRCTDATFKGILLGVAKMRSVIGNIEQNHDHENH